MRYTLRQIEYFIATAETGSITLASERLSISQPSISTAITHLEGELETQLFVRHHAKGLSLTTAGRSLLVEAKMLIQQAERLYTIASEVNEKIRGQLSLGWFRAGALFQERLNRFCGNWREMKLEAARTDCLKQQIRSGRKKNQRRALRRLFEDFQERVRGFFHEVGVAEDVDPFASFGRLEINLVDHVPHLIDLHQHLRRIGGNDHHVRMRLDEDASFFLVGVAQMFASLDGFGEAIFEGVGLGNANAVGAMAAEIRQAIGHGPLQAVHRFRNHLTDCELARARWAGEDQCVRKVVMRKHLPQRVNRLGVAVKIRKRHKLL